MIPIHLAVEDELSEKVLRRLLIDSGRPFHVNFVINRGGFGYLRSKIDGFNKSAKGLPFLVLTDLDQHVCPSALIHDWLGKPISPNLIFRVAVREIEAWILGDRENFSSFLGISADQVPLNPETLADPKRTLVQLATKARRSDVRRRLVPRQHMTAVQGPEYNSCLSEFVASAWSPSASSLVCPSLAKCCKRINEFHPTL
jgi:hypothetical protein